MQRMLAVLAANPAADGAGLVAMVCFIAWPLFQVRWMSPRPADHGGLTELGL